jgi:hypothetical protein
MDTLNLEYTRAIYKLEHQNEEGTLKDYQILKIEGSGSHFFTKMIRIEKDYGFHRRSRYFDNWLYLRNDTNWRRCTKSGLAFTGHLNIFEGNIPSYVELPERENSWRKIENPEHFLIAQVSQDLQYVVLDIFEGFYPHKRELIQYILSAHDFYFKAYKKGA